jgi:hypothetical protein
MNTKILGHTTQQVNKNNIFDGVVWLSGESSSQCMQWLQGTDTSSTRDDGRTDPRAVHATIRDGPEPS